MTSPEALMPIIESVKELQTKREAFADSELGFNAWLLMDKILPRLERPSPTMAEGVVSYLRDLDGTGSFHVCAKGDPGSFPVYAELRRIK